jgi:hypothetical protein
MMYLLDVNALLAMQYQEHVHYTRVNRLDGPAAHRHTAGLGAVAMI